jgi:holo-[acyl-carrier protein] synthase
VGWKDFEVIQPGGRQPRLEFHGKGRELFEALGCTAAHLSLTHDGGLAIATVVIEGPGRSAGGDLREPGGSDA